jgi:outer membrane immunogenic protein
MKRILFATVALAALAGQAEAADMAVKALPPAPVCYWCGFYIGGTAGGAWSDNSVNVQTTNVANNISGGLTPLGLSAAPAAALSNTGSLDSNRSGFVGGVEGGYNWQWTPAWVVGVEADFQGFSGSGSNQITQVVPRSGFPGFNYTGTIAASEKVDWLGTVRGRVGFLIAPSWLLYGTGGLAYGGAKSSTALAAVETPHPPGPFSDIATGGSFSDTRVGWVAGAGVEYLLSRNWTVKGEWLHYDLGSVTYSNGTMNSFIGPALEFTNASTTTVKFTGDIVRAGLNYEF